MALYRRPERIGFLLTAVALAAGLTVGLTASAAPAAATDISLTGVPRDIAVDPAADTAYVAELPASEGVGNVAVIGLASDSLIATIPVGVGPNSIAVDPDTDVVYVVNRYSSTVSVIDGSSNTVSATIPVSSLTSAANGIAVDPATNMVYVGIQQESPSGFPTSGVAVINGDTDSVTGTITAAPACGSPEEVAVNPATDTVYADYWGGSCYNLDVIDGATNTVTTTIPQVQAEAMAVDPVTNTFFVANYADSVTAYSGVTNTVTGTVNIGGQASFVAVNPDTDTVYANNCPAGASFAICLLNGTATALTAEIPETAPPVRLAVDPDTDTLVYAAAPQYPTWSVSLIPLLPPRITTSPSTTFTVGAAGSFNVTATGTPTPTLSESGKLPAGVAFGISGGTGLLSGTPTAGTGGTYTFTITAANGVAPAASQQFMLTVHQAAAITSANHATFTHGKRGSFTMRTTGFPVATVTESGSLPPGVKFTAAKNGTATITGTPAGSARGKTYVLQFTARNGVGKATVQRFTLRVN
jgi:YVTN family beta-propeller protein